MRYFYQKPENYIVTAAKTYKCDHELYSKCTLYTFGDRGLAVVQQRFNTTHKVSWWGEIDPWLIDDIFNQEGFMSVFDKYSGNCTDGIYPTISVRRLMWTLRMKPLKRYIWEDPFDS